MDAARQERDAAAHGVGPVFRVEGPGVSAGRGRGSWRRRWTTSCTPATPRARATRGSCARPTSTWRTRPARRRAPCAASARWAPTRFTATPPRPWRRPAPKLSASPRSPSGHRVAPVDGGGDAATVYLKPDLSSRNFKRPALTASISPLALHRWWLDIGTLSPMATTTARRGSRVPRIFLVGAPVRCCR